MRYESFSSDMTKKIAADISKSAKSGDIYCLTGNLGAGKTQFAKGFAKGLGIDSDVTSPTFTIVNEYGEGRLYLYHLDVYRVNSTEEMFDIGYEEMFFGDGVCIVEWAERIKDIIPNSAINISMDYGTSENHRIITVDK